VFDILFFMREEEKHGSSSKNQKKVAQKGIPLWTEEDMKNAIYHFNSTPGALIRKTAGAQLLKISAQKASVLFFNHCAPEFFR